MIQAKTSPRSTLRRLHDASIGRSPTLSGPGAVPIDRRSLWPLGAGVSDRALRTRPQQALLALLLLAGVTAVLCLYLFQTSRITVTSYGITYLQQDFARLQRENSNLLASYAFEQSMGQMKKRAIAAGFSPVSQLQYVTVIPQKESDQAGAAVTHLTQQISQTSADIGQRAP